MFFTKNGRVSEARCDHCHEKIFVKDASQFKMDDMWFDVCRRCFVELTAPRAPEMVKQRIAFNKVRPNTWDEAVKLFVELEDE